jgi:hypothetical protein
MLCFSASYAGSRRVDSRPSHLLLETMSVDLVRLSKGMIK